ncbi:hypothetical protein L873DRAFT_1822984 [Choiromyces venosus 120613-1]|uniref:Uncharacterized protein n=1 Tax=Choiromyces venosus 120613-1 TaxID=1336337 RepID=A0A3N4IYT6_9PEZI|nr:hypothetical protein L873DRAFT_1822984 [Choiromyces venosus 120613-1]
MFVGKPDPRFLIDINNHIFRDSCDKHETTSFQCKTFPNFHFNVVGRVNCGGESEIVLIWGECPVSSTGQSVPPGPGPGRTTFCRHPPFPTVLYRPLHSPAIPCHHPASPT